MVSTIAFSTLVLSAVMLVRADAPVPDTPGPSQTYNQGANCPIAWSADTTGQWKNMAIQLMTGDNFNMVPLTTVTTLDATTTTSFNWNCPAVTINAPIYFYQFSAQGQNLTWTTRFTIADSTGKSVPAPNTTQPDGQQIGWGTGALTDPSKATPPPSWLAATEGTGSASASAATSASASASAPNSVGVSAAGGGAPASSAPSFSTGSSTSSASSSSASGLKSSTSTTHSSSAGPSSASAASSNTTSGALGRADMAGVLTRSATVLAVVAGIFAFAL